MKEEKYQEAEIEYKESLKLAPEDIALKVGLAEVFFRLDKLSLGLVLIEEITASPSAPGRAWLVYTRLLLKADQAQEAQIAYEKAIIIDPDLKDSYLESDIKLHIQDGNGGEPEKLKLGGEASQGDDEHYLDIERPNSTFEDVGGMDTVK